MGTSTGTSTAGHFARVAITPLDDLRSRVGGMVIVQGDPEYDAARAAWNLTVDQHPALIIVARDAADVVEAVRFARSAQLGIAVQATGHGVVRPADDALLLVTSQMDGVRVDANRKTAWVEAGAKWGRVLEKAQAVGLAPLLGSSPDVGAVGYTLGGGMGWLARKYGLSADSVNYFEVVTPTGRKLRVSHDCNADLFWGLRGGGGSLAIVTGMEIRLYPVTRVYGGSLFYPAAMAREVYARYREWITHAPDELTSSVAIVNFPPLPDFPEPLRGNSFVLVRGCYTGPTEGGEALVEYWRSWKKPLIDDFKRMPFSQVGSISDDPLDPVPVFSTSMWLRELTDEAIDTLVRSAAPVGGSSPIFMAEIRHAGGAITTVDDAEAAYGNRDATLILHLIGIPMGDYGAQRLTRYASRLREDLAPALTGGVYINFQDGEESRKRIRRAYSEQNFRRLQVLKARFDPDNLLRYGFNIQPGQAGE
jgi:FAD/FMN-containing dehydrogenase